jgi:two-component system LytT family sensor kinase
VKRARSLYRVSLASWLLYAVVRFCAALPAAAPGDLAALALVQLVRAATGLGVTALLAAPLRRVASPLGRATAGFVLALVLAASAAWFFADRILLVTIASLTGLDVPWQVFPRGVELEYPVVLAAWSAGFLALRFAAEAGARREEALERDLAAREARLAALRHQLQPHFVLNALNSLRALIAEDAERAREMLTRFSRFLSAALATSSGTTAAEELETLEAWLAVQKARFEDALDVAIESQPEALRHQVPALVLQPLVENAITHGTADRGALRVRIRVGMEGEHLRMVVANPGRLAGGTTKGIGLANTRARLASFYRGAARLDLAESNGWVEAAIEVERPGEVACGS